MNEIQRRKIAEDIARQVSSNTRKRFSTLHEEALEKELYQQLTENAKGANGNKMILIQEAINIFQDRIDFINSKIADRSSLGRGHSLDREREALELAISLFYERENKCHSQP